MENLDQLRIKRQMLMFEMNMIEQKIALLEATTMVTDVPESKSLKTKAIPEQTTPGKESTNPLKAEELTPDYLKAVKQEPKYYYVIYRGPHADPKLIQQAFEAGLINNIYPSHNLQELRHFPQPMVDSIKNFRKKVLKAKDDPIYIKVISSVPDWNQEDGYNPYHFLEIGLAKSKRRFLSHNQWKNNSLFQITF
uniref:Uncharacterized protein n=1 Tax=Tanacetum cinerariifolium TaxID=118510 RepID=A0A699KDJ1_TANCI|nr:hypothetical protein [Tanacetum cinerariifolium]